jgi:hypothetical protein
MNSIKHKRAFPAALAVLAVTISAAVSIPSAYAYTCPVGATCFKDYESGHWGKIFGNNNYWGTFRWNDIADYFYNNGRTHHNCLFVHANRGGPAWRLHRGQGYDPDYFRNKISSNMWTRGYYCR